jgi:proteasome accessory factor C
VSARAASGGARLQRVLALVPWILEHPGVTLAELAERFQVDETELELDLELLPMCGLPPYTADRLIDVYLGDDGAVSIRLAEYFERPLRLTPAEGVALVAAGRALLGVPGSDQDGPLATALAKLEDAVGARGGLSVHVDSADHLDRLREAAERGDQLEIDYYSSARDEMTTRVVDPVRVFHALGAWYLAAWCHRAQGDRLFRVDRVRALRPTGTRVEVHGRDPAQESNDDEGELVYRPAPDDLRVRLRLQPEAAWVAESIPVEERIERARGRVDVVLAVSGQAFLERLLLSLGPAAEVLGPAEAKEIRAVAARRVLARYADRTGRRQGHGDDVGG